MTMRRRIFSAYLWGQKVIKTLNWGYYDPLPPPLGPTASISMYELREQN